MPRSKKCPFVESISTFEQYPLFISTDFYLIFTKPFLDSMDISTTFISQAVITFMEKSDLKSESNFKNQQRFP